MFLFPIVSGFNSSLLSLSLYIIKTFSKVSDHLIFALHAKGFCHISTKYFWGLG